MHELNTPWKGWKRKRGKSERLIYYALVGIKHAVHIAGTLIHGLEQYIFINRKSINSLHCRTFDTNFQKNMWRKYNIYCCWKRFYNGIYKMWKITCRVTIILSVKWFHFSLSFFSLSLFFFNIHTFEIIVHLKFMFRQIEHGNRKYFICLNTFRTMSICTVYSAFKQVVQISFMINIMRYLYGPSSDITITSFQIEKKVIRYVHLVHFTRKNKIYIWQWKSFK